LPALWAEETETKQHLLLCPEQPNARKGHVPKLTVAEVLAELKKLRLVEMTSGRRYLTEVSKRQRLLFEVLNVPVPVAP